VADPGLTLLDDVLKSAKGDGGKAEQKFTIYPNARREWQTINRRIDDVPALPIVQNVTEKEAGYGDPSKLKKGHSTAGKQA
jgi:hypothetical protein